MRRSTLLSLGFVGCALALVVSCNGLVVHERCGGSGAGGGNASGFCDFDGGPEERPPTGPFPGPGFDSGSCAADTTVVRHGDGPRCGADDLGGAAPGQACGSAYDCARVCCVADERGVYFPAHADAGADADAEAEADADASASADAGADAGGDSQWVWSCVCGRCVAADQRCSALDRPGGLGGP